MKLVTLKFGTYNNAQFNTRRLTTEEFVRDPRFEAFIVAIKINDEPVYTLEGIGIYAGLKALNLHECTVAAHDAMLVGAILNWKYDIRPAKWLDTQSMARPIHARTTGCTIAELATYYNLGGIGTAPDTKELRRSQFTPGEWQGFKRYCKQEVAMTHLLLLVLMAIVPQKELDLIEQTTRMFTEPSLMLDKPMLEAHLINVRAEKSLLYDEIADGRTEAELCTLLRSDAKMAEMLIKLGVDPPMKTSPKTKTQKYAFAKDDVGFIALQEHDNPKVQALAAARIGANSSLEETRTEKLIGIAGRGMIPIELNYWGAHTSRFSGGGGVNWQNPPRGGQIRKSLMAPPGHKLIVGDASQIEVRVLAHLAGQNDILDAFRQGRDIYCEFASGLYNRVITKEHPFERFIGKTCILGLGYSMGWRALLIRLAQAGITWTQYKAQHAVRYYRNRFPRIPKLWRNAEAVLRSMIRGERGQLSPYVSYDGNKLRLPNGLDIIYPNLTEAEGGGFYYTDSVSATRRAERDANEGKPPNFSFWENLYGAKFIENIVQGLSRCLITDQILTMHKHCKVVLSVHDEILTCVLTALAERSKVYMERVMTAPPAWALDLPLACELVMGDRYGDLK